MPVANSIQFAAALDKAKIPFELHIFQEGTHGLALAKPLTSSGMKIMVNPDVARWLGLCTAWLENLFGAFESQG